MDMTAHGLTQGFVFRRRFRSALAFLVVVGVAAFSVITNRSPGPLKPDLPPQTLSAEVRLVERALVFANQDSSAWPATTIKLNGNSGYQHRLERVPTGETIEVPLSFFFNAKGDRFRFPWMTPFAVTFEVPGRATNTYRIQP
jgi:hypothetical protein